ncbi:MAG: NYN domain-containing protein [Cyanosarcina radialis HA8281-LM2]|nr:NYN domain-containing protein [Cyanosarcina radialis HA8281-LM2]
MNNSAAIDSISEYVYQTILTTYQQHPDWLREKLRKYPWGTADLQVKFTSRLTAELSQFAEREIWRQKVLQVLQNSLLPSFFISSDFGDLMAQIQLLTRRESEIVAEKSDRSLNVSKESAIAILLLDVENLYLNAEVEKFLVSVCRHPLQIKIAFGNWRNLGKKDLDLHGRSYELIHVPIGKDSADVKMATVGSSIFIHYPTAKEVLVCSSDSVLTHLCNTLQTHGLTVYSVRRQADNIIVSNNRTGETQTHICKVAPEVPSLKEFIGQLKDTIRLEQARSGSIWIPLAKIPEFFNTKYEVTINQLLSIHCPDKQLIDLIREHSTDFASHQLPNNPETYITVFQTNRSRSTANNSSNQPTQGKAKEATLSPIDPNEKIPQGVDLAAIDSPEKLQAVLIAIVKYLTAKSPGSYINISNVGTEFTKQYKQPITKVTSNLGLGKRLPKVFESYQDCKIKKVGDVYEVAIADM